MESLSIWHWIIVLAVIVVLYGGVRKIAQRMDHIAWGISEYDGWLNLLKWIVVVLAIAGLIFFIQSF